MNNEVLRSLERVINVPEDTLDGTETLTALPTWDSLAMVEFISMMDEECGVDVAAEDVRKCRTVQDLLNLAKAPLAG